MLLHPQLTIAHIQSVSITEIVVVPVASHYNQWIAYYVGKSHLLHQIQ